MDKHGMSLLVLVFSPIDNINYLLGLQSWRERATILLTVPPRKWISDKKLKMLFNKLIQDC